jgi:hypothetical protein
MLGGIGVGVMTANVVLNNFIARSCVLDGESRAPVTLVLGEGTGAEVFYCTIKSAEALAGEVQ